MSDSIYLPPNTIALWHGREVFVHKIATHSPEKRLLSYNWHATGWYERIENIQPVYPLKFFTPGVRPDWYGNDQFSTRVEISNVKLLPHMTDEERVLLMQKVDSLFTSVYDDPDTINPDTAELLLVDYVNTLLATRVTEIERLTARQITPEMESIYDKYQSEKGEKPWYFIAHDKMEQYQIVLWSVFTVMMEGLTK